MVTKKLYELLNISEAKAKVMDASDLAEAINSSDESTQSIINEQVPGLVEASAGLTVLKETNNINIIATSTAGTIKNKIAEIMTSIPDGGSSIATLESAKATQQVSTTLVEESEDLIIDSALNTDIELEE